MKPVGLSVFIVAALCLAAFPSLLFAAGQSERTKAQATPQAQAVLPEAPMLTAMVKEGKIPPVEQRVPPAGEVLVQAVQKEIGVHGGTLQVLNLAGDTSKPGRDIGEGLLEFDMDGSGAVVPSLAKRWEVSSDAKEITFFIRKGIRWSDGEPFDANDIEWYWNSVLLNTELTPSVPAVFKAGPDVARFAKLDDHTFRLVFARPNPLFIGKLGSNLSFSTYPPQYLQKFHAAFADKAALEASTKSAGFEKWPQLFQSKVDRHRNPEIPTLCAWKLTNSVSDPVIIYDRNPYYWKTDAKGQQLPYIDRINHVAVEDREAMQLKIIAGESDISLHWLTFEKWPLVRREAEKNNYRVIEMPFPINGAKSAVFFHFEYPDADLVAFTTKKDFRIALSLAIDRDEINQIVWSGLSTGKQPIVSPEHPAYDEKLAMQYTQYDPETANKMLDKLGLDKRDSEGWRLFPNGKRFEWVINADVNNPNEAEMVARNFQKVGLLTTAKIYEYSTHMVKMLAAEHPLTVDSVQGGMTPLEVPGWFFPVDSRGARWAGPTSRWYESGGKQGTAPDDPGLKRLIAIYEEASMTSDVAKRNQLLKETMKIHVDNMWRIGIVQWAPVPGLVKNYVHNVPDVVQYSSDYPQGRYLRPEQFFIRGK